AVAVGNDTDCWAELVDDLPAGAAWGGGGLGRRVDGDALQFSLAGGDGGENGGALGAVAQAVGGVLDVAAGEDFPRFREDGGADAELGVGGIGAAGGGLRRGLELLELGGRGHQKPNSCFTSANFSIAK